MKICSLSSGSNGNCVYVETDKSKILVDGGLSGRQIQNLLKEIGVKGSEIDLIFVTHEHSDHTKGVGVLSRRFDIPIYANEKTWYAMRKKIGEISAPNINIFKTNNFLNIRDFDLLPFSVFHDAKDPVGFSFYQNNEKISIMTDTGKVNTNIINAIKDSDIYYLEANHDIEMLRNGPYPINLQERIRGENGHLSNFDSADLLLELLNGNREKVILAHLSEENNAPNIAKFTVENELLNNGLDINRDVVISVASRYEPSNMYKADRDSV